MAFKESTLPSITRSIHKSQNRWRCKNWNKSLEKHCNEIEDLLEKTSVFNKWRNRLQHVEATKTLMPEVFIDAWTSVHLACFGLYKYANMCLRSELENVLRMIFFSTHPVEFEWWLSGNEWYRVDLQTDVWGRSYIFFENLETIKRFEKNCSKSRKLFSEKQILRKLHKNLSKFIHSGPGYFQTESNEFAPSYNPTRFKVWSETYKTTQTIVNILLALGFAKDFKGMTKAEKEAILEKGIGRDYRNIVEKTLNLCGSVKI